MQLGLFYKLTGITVITKVAQDGLQTHEWFKWAMSMFLKINYGYLSQIAWKQQAFPCY